MLNSTTDVRVSLFGNFLNLQFFCKTPLEVKVKRK
jgi:hypothetical protein